jgi:hypothetical protein
VNKRLVASGYANLDNELSCMDKTMMAFGDARRVIEDRVTAVERRRNVCYALYKGRWADRIERAKTVDSVNCLHFDKLDSG